MNTSGNIYASRKRKKPQTSVKPTQREGVKSNPSKRHRERLNGELERLANLLPFPQDVISKLDKLTVLRLCVSYLRAKSFFNVTLKSTNNYRPESNGLNKLGPQLKEGELLLQVLNGFILVVTAGGTIFYVSSTIQDYLGFNQSDIIHQSAYDLIHTEDRAEFQRQLHWALDPTFPTDSRQLVAAAEESPLTYYNPEDLPPENSAFLERNFVCRVRCLLDNSSGFITLNFQGYLKFLHGQNERTKDGAPIPPQLALFTVAAPLQPPAILEIQTTNVIFRTRHKLDFTPTDCDAKGRIVLGYTEVELCERGSGYQFIHAADMHHCAENHIRLMKMGESGMTVFRLLTKNRSWVWVQAKAHLIYKNGLPDCIIASQRVLTDEEGEENLRKRKLEFPFCFTTGEAMLYDFFPNTFGNDSTNDSSAIGMDNNNQRSTNSMLGSLLKQDESIYGCVCSESKPQEDPEGQPEEDCGGIFSSRWQSCPVPSLSESSLFKQEPQGSMPEENIDGELWSLMRTLGITREDFELFQQDEMFLNMDFGGTGSDLSVTDEILSFVQQSLSNKLDWVFSCSTRLGNQGPSFTALEQQNHLSAEQPSDLHQQSSTDPRWQQEQLQQLSFHPQSGNHYPPPVQSQHGQHQVQKQKSMPCQDLQIPQRSVHGQVLPNQQLSQHRGSVCSQPVPRQQQCCHRLTLMQVNGSSHLQSQCAFNSIQETPPLFQLDQPGLLVHSHPQHKHLCLGEPTLNNHLNTLSVSCPPELSSYVPPGPQSQGVWNISPQDPEELLNSRDSGQELKQDGVKEPWWGVEARSMYQLHLTDRQPPSLVLPQYSLPKKLSLVTPAEQPIFTQNGILQETSPLSYREENCGPSEQAKHQAKHQAPAESWPYLDLSLMGFM